MPPTAGEIIDPADKKIPYQPWAVAKRNELRTKGFEDPQGHCAPSGAPRKNNTLFGWRIIQPKGYVTFLYESMHDYRIIPTDGRKHLPASIKMWHGDPVGHWEGDTLVVDYTNLNGKHWFDMSGNFQSENIHVVERYTMFTPDTILFVATIEDSTLYTRPWTLAFSLERNKEPGLLPARIRLPRRRARPAALHRRYRPRRSVDRTGSRRQVESWPRSPTCHLPSCCRPARRCSTNP